MFRKLTVFLAAAVLLLSIGGCSVVRRLINSVLPGTMAPTAAITQLQRTSEPAPEPSHLPKPTTQATDSVEGLPTSRQDILDAFQEIAFSSEYGSTTNSIRKWSAPVRAALHGAPTEEDLAALDRAMDGLNAIDGFPGIGLTEANQNMDIWFVPLNEMPDVVSGYVEGNWGFFSASAQPDGISACTVAIATDVTSQQERNHLIFEEVIQSTGLMQDSDRYADSIFYGQWTTVQQPTKLDWLLLTLLYNPEIKHGMQQQSAMQIIVALLPAEPDLSTSTDFD